MIHPTNTKSLLDINSWTIGKISVGKSVIELFRVKVRIRINVCHRKNIRTWKCNFYPIFTSKYSYGKKCAAQFSGENFVVRGWMEHTKHKGSSFSPKKRRCACIWVFCWNGLSSPHVMTNQFYSVCLARPSKRMAVTNGFSINPWIIIIWMDLNTFLYTNWHCVDLKLIDGIQE